jgi:hypothetical protein
MGPMHICFLNWLNDAPMFCTLRVWFRVWGLQRSTFFELAVYISSRNFSHLRKMKPRWRPLTSNSSSISTILALLFWLEFSLQLYIELTERNILLHFLSCRSNLFHSSAQETRYSLLGVQIRSETDRIRSDFGTKIFISDRIDKVVS